MLVELKRTWFAPNGFRYRKRQGGVRIPDALVDFLPKDATIMTDPASSAPEEDQKEARRKRRTASSSESAVKVEV